MPEIDEAALKKQLSSGQLYGVYVLAGEEKYLVKRAAGRLIKKAAGEAFPEFNRNEFKGDAAMDGIADAAQALPFFAEHKCVAVSDLNVEERDSAELEKLYELLELSPDTTTLVFWYPTLDFDGRKSAKWKKFLKEVQSRGGVLLFGRRSASDLQKLLLREAEKAGCVLSRQNAGRIVEYAGQDVTQLLQEMEKLCAFALGQTQTVGTQTAGTQTAGTQTVGTQTVGAQTAGAQGVSAPEITARMIEELVPKTTETTVFLMSNALTAGNYEKAYTLLDSLFYQNEEPIAILGVLSSAYVDMYRVRTALESGKPAGGAAEYGEYKGKEFRLRNAERSSKGLSPEALRESLGLLLEADMALKGSKLDSRIVLEELIAKLLLAAKGETKR